MPSRGQVAAITPSFFRRAMGERPSVLNVGNLIFKRAALSGSIIGGVTEIPQMLDYCVRHNNITADVENIPSRKLNEAFEHLLRQDADYRFVIDMNTAGLRTRQLSGATL